MLCWQSCCGLDMLSQLAFVLLLQVIVICVATVCQCYPVHVAIHICQYNSNNTYHTFDRGVGTIESRGGAITGGGPTGGVGVYCDDILDGIRTSFGGGVISRDGFGEEGCRGDVLDRRGCDSVAGESGFFCPDIRVR